MKKLILAGGVAVLTVVTSCRDTSYDFDNKDMTMQYSTSVVWLPNGSTEKALLENLFNIDDNDNFKIVDDPESDKDNMYCMQGEGDLQTDLTVPTGTTGWTTAQLGETQSTVDLDDIPGFLKEEGTSFDVKNPIILVKVDKTAGVDFKTRLRLTSVKDGVSQKIVETKTAEELKVTGNSTGSKAKLFYIAAEEVSPTYLPEEYQGATWVQLSTAASLSTIQELIRDIPDQIVMEVIDTKGKTSGASSSDVDIDYLFYAPMRPDTDFNMGDSDIADKIRGDIKDIIFDEFVVQTDVEGDLPMTIRLEPVAVDENGDEMSEVEVTVNDDKYVELPANKTTTLSLTLRAKDGGMMSRYTERDMFYFDGIRFKYTLLKPITPGAKIYSDMYVRLTKMKLGVKGIGYDAN